jgi:uncharacterized membrane protein
MDRVDKFCDRFGDAVIWLCIAAYVSLFSYICFLKYSSFGYFDWDFASEVSILWNSVHGKLLYYPFLEEIILGAHAYFIFLCIMPFYALFQHPYAHLVLQSLFLGLAAYPLYLLAKLKLNKTFALAISLAYLLYPALGFMNLFETHVDIFVVFFFFFALYYFEIQKFCKFLIFIVLAIICKESVSLIVCMLGVYACIRKRPMRWCIVPVLLGITWFFLTVKIVIPYFAKNAHLYPGGFIFSVYYQHLGGSILEMIKTIIIHPLVVAKYAFTGKKIYYLFQLFAPTGFIVAVSPAVLLITVPIFMQNLLSSVPTHSSIHYQYTALLIPLIFASVVYSFSKLLAYKSAHASRGIFLGLFLAAAVSAGINFGAPQLYCMNYIRSYAVTDFTKAERALVRRIPKDAPVIATFKFLPMLANRYELYSMHFVSTGKIMYTNIAYEPPQNLEYALIDFNEPLMTGSFFPPEAPLHLRSFIQKGNWTVLSAVNDIVLFKKDYREGDILCEPVQDPKIAHVVNAVINNQMVFLGYDVKMEDDGGKAVTHVICYWKRIGAVAEQLGLFLQFSDAGNKVVFDNVHIFGYRVYEPQSFPEGQIFKEHLYIFRPAFVKEGTYKVTAGLFNVQDGKLLPVLKGDTADRLGAFSLGEVSL